MERASFNDWVEIERVLLEPENRLAATPEDTRNTPLRMRVAGFLQAKEATVGDRVKIKTPIGRIWQGELVTINARPQHRFGPPVNQLQVIGPKLRSKLKEGGR